MSALASLAPHLPPDQIAETLADVMLHKRAMQIGRGNPMTDALLDAAEALEALADGGTPDRTTALLVAAQTLDGLCTRGPADRELLDAAAGLKTIATGGTASVNIRSKRRDPLFPSFTLAMARSLDRRAERSARRVRR
jgi:hypothetical protein